MKNIQRGDIESTGM